MSSLRNPGGRGRDRIRLGLLVLAGVCLLAGPAAAATLNVPVPYATIGAAIAASAPNDIIQVAAGAYPETITIPHSLTLQGAGAATTSIDVSGNPAAGTVITISGITANVTINGFKIVTGPASAVNSNGIWLSNIGAGSLITVSENEIWCVQSALGTAMENFGLIAGYGSQGHLVFDHNTVYGGGDNPVLLERWFGPLDFTWNTVYRGPDDTVSKDVIFVMNNGASNVTAHQVYDHNTIDVGGGATFDYAHRGTGLTIAAQYVGGAGPGGYTDVVITNNNVVNLKASRRGIGLWDNSSGPGDILAVIQDNTVTAAPAATGELGIRLLGGITGTTVSGNDLSGMASGFTAQPYNGFDPTGFTLQNNNIHGNTAGVTNLTASSIDASCNWWGSIAGPNMPPVNPTGNNGISGAATYIPWLDAPAPGGACNQYPDDVTPNTSGLCLSTVHTCVTVPVEFNRVDTGNARGISVTFQLSSNLQLCGTPATSILQGSWLAGFGTNYLVVDNTGGSYTVDQAILGLPCGVTTGGTLFTVDVMKAPSAGDGTGYVTVTGVTLRDCSNAWLPAVPGLPGAIPIDITPPDPVADLAAAQVKTGNDSDGTTGIQLSFAAPGDAAEVEVYRKAFGNYPEYDDAPGAGSVPPVPVGYPPVGWTLTAVTASGQTDEVTDRDFWYFVLYTKDGCGNVSLVSNRTNGTLNYHLGDTHNGSADCAGDNLVNTADISHLGANYGVSGLPWGDPRNCLDVGPTTDYSVNARPTTDNRIQFEDLMMFAINYGQVSKPGREPAVAAGSDALRLVVPDLPAAHGTFEVGLGLAAAGDLQGVSLYLAYDRSVVEPVDVSAGELLGRQGVRALVLSSEPGNVDVAVMGSGAVIRGEGELARVTFRVIAAGDPKIEVARVEGRDTANRAVALLVASTSAGLKPPVATFLGPNYPNPFSGSTMIPLALKEAGPARLSVFDVNGRLVKTLLDGFQPAGGQTVEWDGRDAQGARVSSGFYVIRLEFIDGVQSRPVKIVR